MHKTTIYFDDDTALALRHTADLEGRSQAEIIREALRNYLRQLEDGGKRQIFPPGVGAYRSGRSDVSVKSEEILRAATRKPK